MTRFTLTMLSQQDILEQAKLTATKDAKKLVIETIPRTATEHAVENSVSIFNIESDDIKGKVIGREGRNIRALEAATGVEFIADDTPEAIIISGFDPVRREIARLSLHRLVQEGIAEKVPYPPGARQGVILSDRLMSVWLLMRLGQPHRHRLVAACTGLALVHGGSEADLRGVLTDELRALDPRPW